MRVREREEDEEGEGELTDRSWELRRDYNLLGQYMFFQHCMKGRDVNDLSPCKLRTKGWSLDNRNIFWVHK